MSSPTSALPWSCACVTVWLSTAVPAVVGVPLAALGPAVGGHGEQAEQLERAARDTASEGARLARDAGLDDVQPDALPATAAAQIGNVLADLAHERGATVMVVGRRGISRVQAVVLGSVSDATVHSARRPVLVVPTPED